MAYFVGKKDLSVEGAVYPVGAQLPTDKVATWPNLRQLMTAGFITCDYKDGEKRPGELPFSGRTTILTDEAIVQGLAEVGIVVPEGAPKSMVALTYNVVVMNRDLAQAARNLRIRPRLPSWVPEDIRDMYPEPARYRDLDVHEFLSTPAEMLALKPHDMAQPGKVSAENTGSDGEFFPLPNPMDSRVVKAQEEDEMNMPPKAKVPQSSLKSKHR